MPKFLSRPYYLVWGVLCSFVISYSYMAVASNIQLILTDAPPTNCFRRTHYCINSQIVTINGKSFIQVKFFAKFDEDDYEGLEEIRERYMDFASWPDYVGERNRDIRIALSVGNSLEGKQEEGSNITKTHISHYKTRAPAPLYTIEIKERIIYRPIEFKNEDASNIFAYFLQLDKSYNDQAGIIEKDGYVHGRYGEDDNIYVGITLRIRPEISTLLVEGIPYIENAFIAIFRGMFEF